MHRERPIDWDCAHLAIRVVAYQWVGSDLNSLYRIIINDCSPEERGNEEPLLSGDKAQGKARTQEMAGKCTGHVGLRLSLALNN